MRAIVSNPTGGARRDQDQKGTPRWDSPAAAILEWIAHSQPPILIPIAESYRCRSTWVPGFWTCAVARGGGRTPSK